MKKILAMLLVSLMVLGSLAGCFAEGTTDTGAAEVESSEVYEDEALDEIEEEEIVYEYDFDFDSLTVAVTTPMTGRFFTSLWGNNTSDTDVRAMIHGYNLIIWDAEQGMFRMDDSVVNTLVATEDEDGNHTYTIVLNNDLTYSDGTPITAWDYAFSLLLQSSPVLGELGANAWNPEWILGYTEYMNGDADALAGFTVATDDQLSITISGEYLPFFYEMGLISLIPYPASVLAPGIEIADDGDGIYISEEGTQLTAELLSETILDPVTGYMTYPSLTSGPYILTSYEDGIAEFELNPNYKADAYGNKPVISHVTFKSMAQEELVEALENTEIQLINKATSADLIGQGIALGVEQTMFTFSNYARTGLSFISFNAEKDTVADLNMRQALALAMDRDALVSSAVSDYGIRVDGYYGMGQWMVQILNGTIAYPVEEPEDNSAQAQAEYEEQLEAWEELTLEDIEPYTQDAEKAAELLDAAGWNLNAEGDAFAAGTDTLRYRQGENGLEPLKLSLAYGEGSAMAEALENELTAQLAAVGIELSVEAIPAMDLLQQYYHFEESDYDLLFLATNFDVLYDPSNQFVENEDGEHVWKSSGLVDEELYELAVEMRRTEPGDLFTYCVNWLMFQQRFMEILPTIPIYSNVYFDFYPQVLHEYVINANISWPQAINAAFLDEYVEEEEVEEEEEEFIG